MNFLKIEKNYIFLEYVMQLSTYVSTKYLNFDDFVVQVLNAIDAEAKNIAVRVDLDLFKAEVIDNGMGINYEDLKLIGSRYVTSKCKTVSDIEEGRLNYHG